MNDAILINQILREYCLLFNIVAASCPDRNQKSPDGSPLPESEPAADALTRLDGWGKPMFDFIAKSEGLVFSRMKYRYLPYFRNMFSAKYKFKFIAPFDRLIEKSPGKYESVLHSVERDIQQGVA